MLDKSSSPIGLRIAQLDSYSIAQLDSYMPARGYEFYLRVVNSISHEWAQRTSEILSWPLEDKIHIHARACNILFII